MIDPSLLDVLACPETKKDLELASEDVIAKVNAAIEQGTLRNRSQEKVTEKIDGGLLRVGDASALYPIRKDIPILLVDELIVLD